MHCKACDCLLEEEIDNNLQLCFGCNFIAVAAQMGLDEVIEAEHSNSGNISQHAVNLEEVQEIADTILTKVSKQDV
jgi:hypothetical protein